MAYPVFPTLAGVSYPVVRTPNWYTDIQQSASGKKTTLGYYLYPIWHWKLPYEFFRNGIFQRVQFLEIQELMAFFNSVGGPRDLFQYTDPDDNSVTLQGFGTGDGTTTLFQLLRTMMGSVSSFTEPVFAPVTSTIYKNSVALTAGVDYSITTTGGVNFTSAPAAAAVLQWTGTYNFLVRFDDDATDFNKFMSNLWNLKEIKFSSEKL